LYIYRETLFVFFSTIRLHTMALDQGQRKTVNRSETPGFLAGYVNIRGHLTKPCEQGLKR
jgi:hypothetical protein